MLSTRAQLGDPPWELSDRLPRRGILPTFHKDVDMTQTQADPAYANASEDTTLSDRERFAVADANGYWLVLYGDWEGQIYLTVPWAMVGAKARIFDLLKEIDGLEWASNEGDGAGAILYSPSATLAALVGDNPPAEIDEEFRREFANHYSGGMGGGELTDGLWLGANADTDHVRTMLDMRA